jgi:hypothetical protein
VVSKFGEAAWLKILALSHAAPPGGGEFIAMQAYDDKGLYDVVAAACKVPGLSTLPFVCALLTRFNSALELSRRALTPRSRAGAQRDRRDGVGDRWATLHRLHSQEDGTRRDV